MGVSSWLGQQDLANFFPEGRAARIAASDGLATALGKPLAKQPQLRALANAIDAVEGEKHGGDYSVDKLQHIAPVNDRGMMTACQSCFSYKRLMFLARSATSRRSLTGRSTSAWSP